MKTNFKKALIPFGVIVLGVVGAFASNANKQSEKAFADTTHGFYYNASAPVGQRCVMITDVLCSDSEVNTVCTDSSNRQLWKISNNGVTCTGILYKKDL